MASFRSSKPDRSRRSRERRLAGLLALDATLLAAIALGVALELDAGVTALSRLVELPPDTGRLVIVGLAATLATPLAIGLLRTARALGQTIALRALPAPKSGVDLGAAPRRAFLVTWQLVMVGMVGVLLVALSEPFLPAHVGPAIFVIALVVAGIAFWRGATELQGHTRAGAEVIVAALAKQMAGHGVAPDTSLSPRRRASDAVGAPALVEVPEPVRTLTGIYDLIPGLGQPVSVEIGPGDYAAGRTLAELDLRDTTEATVLVIVRPAGPTILPAGAEILREGDLLALAGTAEAVGKAKVLLRSGLMDQAPGEAG
jgi:CPA2 family monovalent cation:H+ antiporter-2